MIRSEGKITDSNRSGVAEEWHADDAGRRRAVLIEQIYADFNYGQASQASDLRQSVQSAPHACVRHYLRAILPPIAS